MPDCAGRVPRGDLLEWVGPRPDPAPRPPGPPLALASGPGSRGWVSCDPARKSARVRRKAARGAERVEATNPSRVCPRFQAGGYLVTWVERDPPDGRPPRERA